MIPYCLIFVNNGLYKYIQTLALHLNYRTNKFRTAQKVSRRMARINTVYRQEGDKFTTQEKRKFYEVQDLIYT